MIWFKDLSSVDAVKSRFRELVKKYHPDISGKNTNKEMAEINGEYKEAIKKAGKKQNWSNEDINDEILESEEYKEVLDKLFKISDIIVELAGTWIWISGDTYANKDKIKKAGCRFAPKKKVWYWRPPNQKYRKHKSELSLNQIREKYDSKVLHGSKTHFLNDKIIRIKTRKKRK